LISGFWILLIIVRSAVAFCDGNSHIFLCFQKFFHMAWGFPSVRGGKIFAWEYEGVTLMVLLLVVALCFVVFSVGRLCVPIRCRRSYSERHEYFFVPFFRRF